MREKLQYTMTTFIAVAFMLSPVVRATGTHEASPSRLKSVAEYPEFKRLVRDAHAGNPQAQYALAIIYEEGRVGIQKDIAYAMSWYEEAARNGLKRANDRLHKMARQ